MLRLPILSDVQSPLKDLSEDPFSSIGNQLHPGDLGAAFAKMLLSLVLLIALLLVSYWFLKRLIQAKTLKGSKNGRIQILEKKAISHKTMLYVVKVEEKKMVIAESQLEVKHLSQLESDEHFRYEDLEETR